MSTKYKATTTKDAFFITITVVGWIDVFTRVNQKTVLVHALQHCQDNKGLEIYAYCIMSSHMHLLCKTPAPARILSRGPIKTKSYNISVVAFFIKKMMHYT